MKIATLFYSLKPLTDLGDLEKRWLDLEARSECSFFLTWNWIGTWLTVTPNLHPLVLSVRDGTEIVGLALLQPARLRRNLISTNALLLHQTGDPATDTITIEYNGILCDRRHAASIGRSIFRFLVQTGTPSRNWNEIRVALATHLIARDAEEAGLICLELTRKQSWFVNLDAIRLSQRPYLESIGRNTRYQIRRAVKLYERRGPITAIPARTQDEAASYLNELKSHHQSTWTKRGRAGSFASTYFEDFHRILIERCLDCGAVELIRVTAGKELIGLLYNFIHRGHIYAYQTGLRYENDQKLKPGLISHYICLNRHLQRGAAVYDFMAGDSRYKANLGIPGPDLMHYVFQRPTLTARGESFLLNLKRRLFRPSSGVTTGRIDNCSEEQKTFRVR